MNLDKPLLPAWAEVLRERYLAGEASVFILYGNVFDQFALGERYVSLDAVLDQTFAKKDTLLELSLAQGVRVVRNSKAIGSLEGVQENGLTGALQYLETNMRTARNVAVSIPYAETIFPATETHFLSFEERSAVTTLHRWSLDDALNKSDSLMVLVTESLTLLAPSLLSNPRIAAIELGLPDLDERQRAIATFSPSLSQPEIHRIAEQTAGLRLIQISAIVGNANQSSGLNEQDRQAYIAELLKDSENAAQRSIDFARVTGGMSKQAIRALIAPDHAETPDNNGDRVDTIIRERKREILEKECSGLIEFIEPKFGLEAVGGCQAIKDELMRVATTLRESDKRRAPMGLLAVGPMGSGKTFVIKAFLKEAGLNGVMLKNFRSQWVGATESNLERVLAMVKVMGPVALVIDEGDRSFGSRSEDNDGGTSSRVIARLKTFMSEPENRGQVLFILMTNRPDKLDIDIKRPGRLDVKLPFFYAQNGEERAGILQALIRRYGMQWTDSPAALQTICEPLQGYSNADLEGVVLLASASSSAEQAALTIEDLTRAVQDFMPPQDRKMVEYMELLAAMECSRRSWLPEHLRQLSVEEIQTRLSALQAIIH